MHTNDVISFWKYGGSWRRQLTSCFQFNDVTVPEGVNNYNFIEISQSTADIYIFSVLQSKRSPYWKAGSGFAFYLTLVIVLELVSSILNFTSFAPPVAYLWHDVISILNTALSDAANLLQVLNLTT